MQHELGRYAAAQRDVERASVLLPAGARADLVHQQAALLQNVGRLAEAEALYRRLVADPGTPSAVRAKAANNAAHLETELGRPVAALVLIDLAGRLADSPTLAAYVALTRAWVTVQAGRLAESLERFEQAPRCTSPPASRWGSSGRRTPTRSPACGCCPRRWTRHGTRSRRCPRRRPR